jgi:hypothetical protein
VDGPTCIEGRVTRSQHTSGSLSQRLARSNTGEMPAQTKTSQHPAQRNSGAVIVRPKSRRSRRWSGSQKPPSTSARVLSLVLVGALMFVALVIVYGLTSVATKFL